jgi:MFS family permease
MRLSTVDETPARSESLYTPSFLLLLATQTCYGMSFSTFFLLPKYLKLSLHADEVQIGAVGAVGSVAGVIAFPLVGMLNDRYGRKPFMLMGSALVTITALALLALTQVGLPLYLFRLLQGLSFALFYNSATTLVSDRVTAEKIGVALGVFGSSMLVTNALAPALSEFVANHHGWDWVFWISASWGFASLLLGLFVREGAREHSGLTVPPKGFGLDRRGRVVALAIAGAGAGFGTVFTFHQPYALEVGIQQVSGFFIAYAVTALFGRMLLLRHIDRFDRRNVSALSTFLYALAVAATAWLRPGLLEGIGAVLGCAHGILYPVFNALAIQNVGPKQRGAMMALYHGGFNGGMAIALLVGGMVIEHFGYPTLFLATGCVTALAALYLWRSPELVDTRLARAVHR